MGSLRICCAVAVAVWLSAAAFAAADGVALPPGYLKRAEGRVCGFLGSRWVPGSLRQGVFLSYDEQLQQLRARLGGTTGKVRSRLRAKIASLRARLRAARSDCKKLRNPKPAKLITNLLQLPPMEEFATRAALPAFAPRAISGEPPTIARIPGLGAKNVFWRPGFIDSITGSAMSPPQCVEYIAGPNDGDSGGFTACTGVQAISSAFEPVSRSAAALCYVRDALTQANLDSGAVRLVRGSIPAGGIRGVFTAGGSDRVIEIRLLNGADGDETDFVKVYSEAANAERGAMYRFEAWRCFPGNDFARSCEISTVDDQQNYQSHIEGKDDISDFSITLTAHLRDGSDGKIVYDPSQERVVSALTAMKEYEELTGKVRVAIGVDALIRTKFLGQLAGTGNQGRQRVFSVTRYAGNELNELQALETAQHHQTVVYGMVVSEIKTAAEWRYPYYASAPENALINALDEVNLATDPFFTALEPVDIDLSAYPCSASSDIVVEVDVSNSAISAAVAACNATMLSGSAFCVHDPVLWDINTDFVLSCSSLFG